MMLDVIGLPALAPGYTKATITVEYLEAYFDGVSYAASPYYGVYTGGNWLFPGGGTMRVVGGATVGSGPVARVIFTATYPYPAPPVIIRRQVLVNNNDSGRFNFVTALVAGDPTGAGGTGGGNTSITIAGLTYKGGYSPATTYAKDDMVDDGTKWWLSLVNSNLGNALVDGGGKWRPILVGTAGAAGATGATGATGPKGPAGSLPNYPTLLMGEEWMLVATLSGISGTNYNWRKVTSKIRSATDYDDTTPPTNGQVITWDSGSSKFLAKTFVYSISGASDYSTAVAPTAGSVMRYNGTKWAAKLPVPKVLFNASFTANGEHYFTAHDILTVGAVQIDNKSGSSPGITYELTTDSGATWAAATFPQAMALGNTLRITVTGLAAGEWATFTANEPL